MNEPSRYQQALLILGQHVQEINTRHEKMYTEVMEANKRLTQELDETKRFLVMAPLSALLCIGAAFLLWLGILQELYFLGIILIALWPFYPEGLKNVVGVLFRRDSGKS